MTETVGAVLVIGGGVAGVQSSLDLAGMGFKVYLLDGSPSIGGVMAQLDKTFPTNDCAMCILAPKLVEVARHPNIELLTYSEVKRVSGRVGNFTVEVLRKPRFVDEAKCLSCGVCSDKCPVKVPSEFDYGLVQRKAIYLPFPQAVPPVYTIDREHCLYFTEGVCRICEKMCRQGAIRLDQRPEELTITVGSIIVATGNRAYEPTEKSEYGYGLYKNVITSIQLERLLNAAGPTAGKLLRPSDGKAPRRIGFLQCVGSRDDKIGRLYCSSVCCMYSVKEAVIAREHNPDLQCTIFFLDMRSHGKEFDDYRTRAQTEYGIRFVRGLVSKIEEEPDTRNLVLKYAEAGDPKEEEFDLVVLSVGIRPQERSGELAKKLGIALNKYDFCLTQPFSPLETSRPGIYVCGAYSSPKDIPDSVAQASGAAAKAANVIASERGRLVAVKEYPPERDIEGEEPRVGVFICHCGINIGGIVDVPAVVEHIKGLPNVVYAEEDLYTCSQDTQERIKEKIREHRLNRVVVASCTPRTHEPLFRETVREAGLNPYLFEMANIRDQCSWVHMHEPGRATEKAKDLVRSAVAKARLLRPLKKPAIGVTPSALVIGGGLSGMTAALELAGQGFEVHLAEREKELGGNLRRLHYVLGGDDPQERLRSIIERVRENERIHVYTGAEILHAEGYVGNFRTTLAFGGEEREVEHGAIVVATGGVQYRPSEYLYGNDERVVTQLELEELLAKGKFDARTVVMIQCVGSRNSERPNCSRVCCAQAVKNALKIKELRPETEVYVLYRDMRTYGLKEDYYREAAGRWVLFIRYEEEEKPEVTNRGGSLRVLVRDPVLKERLLIEPDLLVLSAAVLPHPSNKYIAQLLKVPLSRDGFFLEAHMKLRPLDFATDGIFLCGLAHAPKPIEESISQACGAAARAATILSKKGLEVEGAVAVVDPDLCSGCGTCVALCPYGAMRKDERGIARVTEVLCKGCGTCGASCPERAITMGHFTDEQITEQVLAALGEETPHGRV